MTWYNTQRSLRLSVINGTIFLSVFPALLWNLIKYVTYTYIFVIMEILLLSVDQSYNKYVYYT